jgi:hypothetical protein
MYHKYVQTLTKTENQKVIHNIMFTINNLSSKFPDIIPKYFNEEFIEIILKIAKFYDTIQQTIVLFKTILDSPYNNQKLLMLSNSSLILNILDFIKESQTSEGASFLGSLAANLENIDYFQDALKGFKDIGIDKVFIDLLDIEEYDINEISSKILSYLS